jgi:SAM-dependent methyltransferase
MKPFATYQYISGELMTDRDLLEVGSRFWNEGKFNNFVLPFLPADCSDKVFVDIGCNAGIFLKLASDMGFARVAGVDANRGAIERASRYRAANGGQYSLSLQKMEKCLDSIPAADYIVMANTHYYFDIEDWLRFLDRLKAKTAHCIIVTADVKFRIDRPGADLARLRHYFADWAEEGVIDNVPLDNDPYPRKLYGICFKSPVVRREELAALRMGNQQGQDEFLNTIDGGGDYTDTYYYRMIKAYRPKWPDSKLQRYFKNKIKAYNDIEINGFKEPVVVGGDRVYDGNHRCAMARHFGYKSVLIRTI